MISPNFYTTDSQVRYFFAGKLVHYPIKPPIVVLAKVPYVIKDDDTLYSIAAKWFSPTGEHYWTIIADINNGIESSDLVPGDTIYLPKIIVNETRDRINSYETNTTSTIKV